MKIKAVIDRIVDEKKAVLLAGDKETEHIADVSMLPSDAKEGDWLSVYLDNGEIIAIEPDPDETERVKQRIEEKMARLRARKGSKFKK
ncbi:MAG: DUF3006 domain-containing protein [Clostridia bacterium]|mgnify:CR=1 FL=1|jgi:hypothetical protein